MNFFERTSVKIRFLYLVLVIVIFTVFSVLTFLHTIHSITALSDLQEDAGSFLTEIQILDPQLEAYAMGKSAQGGRTVSLQQEIFTSCDKILEEIRQLKNEKLIRKDGHITASLDTLSWHITSLKNDFRVMAEDPGMEDRGTTISGLHTRHIVPLYETTAGIRKAMQDASSRQQKQYAQNLLFVLFISIAANILTVSLSEISNYNNIRQLLKFSGDLDRGNRREKIHLSSGSEFREIARTLNSFLEKQAEKIRFLRTIGEGENQRHFTPESTDILGNEINVMAERLQKSRQEEALRHAEDKRRNWTSEGIAQFSELLRSESENIKELSYLVIRKLVEYLEIEMGTLFLTMEEDTEERRLETIAAYAFDRRKYIDKTFRFGEGLPGTCAIEKEKIYMNDIPESFSDIISGVGQTRPRHALLFPLKIREEIIGVIELASFRALEKHEFDFIDQIANIIASGLQTVKNNERTASLLQQSGEQAKQLSSQKEELRINLEKLEQARKESMHRESEMKGFLNAINESSLVAEYSPDGHFTHINNKFLRLLEVTSETVLGKHHDEFAGAEKYTDAYKKFWETLKSGTPVTKEEKLILYSGKEIWLQQTYSPVLDEEGMVTKILNIATDITLEKKLQDELETVSRELERLQKELG